MLKIDDLKDVFELAKTTEAFIDEMLKIESTSENNNGDYAKLASSGNDAQLASSGDAAKLASSGYAAKLASSGNDAQLASSGHCAQLASSGNDAQLASSGDHAQLASSGDYARLASSGHAAKLASSGDYARLASSGHAAQLASSGRFAKLASSGHAAKLASSGDYARLASSGDYARLASSGCYAKLASSGYCAQLSSSGYSTVVAAIGKFNIACAKKGSWITLAEYNNQGQVLHVKTEQVDGEHIKEDVFYTLYNKEFHEVEEIDGVKTVILKRRKNVCKAKILDDDKEIFVFSKDGVNAHGKTVKQAYRDWLFKNSDRDASKYENLKPDEVHSLAYWYECYRTITGACSSGTEWFIDTHKPKEKMTLKEVLEITKGQYNYHLFEEFFEVKAND